MKRYGSVSLQSWSSRTERGIETPWSPEPTINQCEGIDMGYSSVMAITYIECELRGVVKPEELT